MSVTTRVARALVATALLAADAGLAVAQPPAAASPGPLPFAIGERLTYRAHSSTVGNVGRGTLWIDGPDDVRGTPTWHLHFDIDSRVGPVRIVDRSESWLDPLRVRALRFHKHERHPLSRHDERVELLPDVQRWEAADGTQGESPSDAPLDELSFLYFLRTLPLDSGTTLRFDRHFDAARNPTTIVVLGSETLVTPAGTFRTRIVEMHVVDARRYRGGGMLRIHLTDDACRIPVRIQSRMPLAGTSVLTLEGQSHAPGACAAETP